MFWRPSVRMRCLGSGDAFGTGGRLQSCFHIEAGNRCFLVECGASALISMWRFDVDPNTIEAIVTTHLHGDHFGGLPFFILDAHFVSRRAAPLTLAGPPGFEQRLREAREVLFPGSSGIDLRFQLNLMEMPLGLTTEVDGIPVTTFPVKHSSGAPALALRIAVAGKILSWSGDTEWVDTVAEAARDADLLVSECYTYDKKVSGHMDFAALREGLSGTGVKRVLLTHMSAQMLSLASFPAGFERAEDALEVTRQSLCWDGSFKPRHDVNPRTGSALWSFASSRRSSSRPILSYPQNGSPLNTMVGTPKRRLDRSPVPSTNPPINNALSRSDRG